MTRSSMPLVLVLSTLLCGCATAVPVVDFYDAESDTLRRYAALEIAQDAATNSRGYRDLGIVQGLYCSRSPDSHAVISALARAEAIDQVKLKAARLGATRINIPSCAVNHEMDLTNNCWASVICESSAWQQDSG